MYTHTHTLAEQLIRICTHIFICIYVYVYVCIYTRVGGVRCDLEPTPIHPVREGPVPRHLGDPRGDGAIRIEPLRAVQT